MLIDLNFAPKLKYETRPESESFLTTAYFRLNNLENREKGYCLTSSGKYLFLNGYFEVPSGIHSGIQIRYSLCTNLLPDEELWELDERVDLGFLRSLVESNKGIRPDDDSKQAQRHRQINSPEEFDNLKCVIRIGVMRDQQGQFESLDEEDVVLITPDQSWHSLALSGAEGYIYGESIFIHTNECLQEENNKAATAEREI